MGNPFALELTSSGDSVELRYPVSAAGYGVLVGLLFLGLLYPLVGSSSALRPVWMAVLDLTIVAVAGNSVRLLWLSTVRFDLARDRVRRGFRTIGRVSDIVAIEPRSDERASLQVVFAGDHARGRRWPISGVRPGQAGLLGGPLAEALDVPFRQPLSGDA